MTTIGSGTKEKSKQKEQFLVCNSCKFVRKYFIYLLKCLNFTIFFVCKFLFSCKFPAAPKSFLVFVGLIIYVGIFFACCLLIIKLAVL